MYEAIPEELKQLNQWVCWKGVTDPARPGKIKKIPVNARTGGGAQSNNPASWCDYETALEASSKYSGIGFMFANGYFGVDIDDIRPELEAYQKGDMNNLAAEFIYSLESYTEFSQSGNGLHIICRGTLPEGGRRKGKVEMYSEGRFFIMTGKPAAEYAGITDCTEAVKLLHAKYIGNSEPAAKESVSASQPLNLDDGKLLEIIHKSKQGAAFDMLYSGNWQGLYSSQSEADIALCSMLAFWCGREKIRMDGIFRQSGLMREKWDRKTGRSTYGEMTLSKAIKDCREIFTLGSSAADDFHLQIGEEIKPRKFYSFDDTGNAERFTERFGDVVRYDHNNAHWYVYNGKKWTVDDTGAVKRLADRLIKEMESDIAWISTEEEEKAYRKHLKYTKSSKGKRAMLEESKHLVSIRISDFDRNRFLLNVQNGVLDLRNGELLAHDMSMYHSKICNVEYSDKADCPQWQMFLNVIFECDKELIRYAQKLAGIFLTGDISEQAVFFLFGNGRNGKSTFINALYNILGEYALTMQPEVFLTNKWRSVPEYEIAVMKGARLVTTAEPSDGVRLNESLIKQMTGGEPLTGRFPYGVPFSFFPEYKLCMSTNYKPNISGVDEGIWRRIHLIPFDVQIPADKVDRQLPYKLRKEYVGILNWAVDGCLLWQREGLEQPEAVKAATAEYRQEMDKLGNFLEECTEEAPGAFISSTLLYEIYCDWCARNNERESTQRKFSQDMQKRYTLRKRNPQRGFVGLKLKES